MHWIVVNSILLHRVVNNYRLNGPGPAECAKRLNPPPPEGSERVRMDFEIVFEILRIKRVLPGPAHSAPVVLVTPDRAPIRSKIEPKIDQNFDVILVSFLVPLGSLLGPPEAPQIDPRSTQDRPKTHLDTTFWPKPGFLKI